MKFLVDAQLPPALAEWLRAAGHEATHVRDVALLHASDTAIRDFAGKNGSVLVTKDRDFIPTERTEVGIQVIWVRTGNMTTRDLLERVENALPQIITHLADGEKLVELR